MGHPDCSGLGWTEATAAGGFNAKAIAGSETKGGFAGEGFDGAVRVDERVAAAGTGCATLRTVRRILAALGEDGGRGFGEHFEFADEAVATVELACTAGISAQRVGSDADGK